MNRRIALAFALLMMVAVGTAGLMAHDEFRIIGTLTKRQDSRIEIKSRTGKTVSVRLDKQTAVTRDDKKVEASALKVGQSLVVDAYGDTEADSLAVEIRIVPPIKEGSR
jgi:hypothetical protein